MLLLVLLWFRPVGCFLNACYGSGTILSTSQELAHLILTTNLLGGTVNYFHFTDGEAEAPRDPVIFQRLKVRK